MRGRERERENGRDKSLFKIGRHFYFSFNCFLRKRDNPNSGKERMISCDKCDVLAKLFAKSKLMHMKNYYSMNSFYTYELANVPFSIRLTLSRSFFSAHLFSTHFIQRFLFFYFPK